jgi:transcriptional regulator with XRE-family HTH domain
MAEVKYATRRVMITGDVLHEIRGKLIQKKKRNVTWIEICEFTGIGKQTLLDIRNGKLRGSPRTLERLLKLREWGIMIEASDFIQKPGEFLD